MPNFADCVSRLSTGAGKTKITLNRPNSTILGHALHLNTLSNAVAKNGFKLGGLPRVALDVEMAVAAAKQSSHVSKKYLNTAAKELYKPNNITILENKYCGPMTQEELQALKNTPILSNFRPR